MKITVHSLFRNSEDHLARTLPQFESLLEVSNCDFKFYENDSEDNTLGILQDWGKAEVFSENLNAPSFGSVPDEERTKRLAYYRNKLKELAGPVEDEYTLLVDSDLFWDASHLEKLIKSIEGGAAMITPNTQQNLPDFMFKKGETSYYDVFPFFDSNGERGAYFSSSPFYDKGDRRKWYNGELVKTISSFAGFALIRSEIYNKVSWSSDGESEHVNFCKEINKFGEIFADPKVLTRTEVNLDKLNMDAIRNIAAGQRMRYEEVNS